MNINNFRFSRFLTFSGRPFFYKNFFPSPFTLCLPFSFFFVSVFLFFFLSLLFPFPRLFTSLHLTLSSFLVLYYSFTFYLSFLLSFFLSLNLFLISLSLHFYLFCFEPYFSSKPQNLFGLAKNRE
jgi:hypothetical protein